MASPETAKPAREVSAEPVSKIEWLGGPLNASNTPSAAKLQAQTRWLTRRFLISAPLAAAIACLVFPETRT
jgi:hypothetical protein